MHPLLDHLGVAVGAITGVLAARGKHVDLFGVIVLAIVTAMGGGTVRDVIIGDLPVFWAVDAGYLINACITAVLTFYVVRFWPLPMTVLLVADAFVLAFFATVGTRKAMAFAMPDAVAVGMGVVTGVAGGIIRDVLVGEVPIVFRAHTYLYATAALIGTSTMVVLSKTALSESSSVIIGGLVTLLLRLAGIRWRIGLPSFKPHPRERGQS